MLRVLGFLCLFMALCQTSGASQAPDSTLKGLTVVDARVLLYFDERITINGGMPESQAISAMERRFALELRKLGLIVKATGYFVLWCEMILAYSGGGLVATSTEIDLMEQVTLLRRGHTTWANTWSKSAVGLVQTSILMDHLEHRATWCAESFGNAWLEANPRR